MELIELKRELWKMLVDRSDYDVFVMSGGMKSIPNRAGRLLRELENDALDVCDTLQDVEKWMEDNEPYLTDEELSLKSEVNRHICILLTQEI